LGHPLPRDSKYANTYFCVVAGTSFVRGTSACFSFHNFDFAPVNNFVQKKSPGCGCVQAQLIRQIRIPPGKKLVSTSALTPALSSRRGRTIRRLIEKTCDRICRTAIRKTKRAQSLFLLLGEKVRMRAVVKPLFTSPEPKPVCAQRALFRRHHTTLSM